MNKYILPVTVGVVCLGVGYYVGQKTFTPQTIDKEVIKTEYKVEYKTDEKVVAAAIETWKNNNKSWWKETKYVKVPCPKCPTLEVGGTKCPEAPACEECRAEVIYVQNEGGTSDNSSGTKEGTSESSKQTEGTNTGKQEVKTTYNKADWLFSAKVGLEPGAITDWSGPTVYGAEVSRRIIGPFFLGLWTSNGSNWQFGASVTAEW